MRNEAVCKILGRRLRLRRRNLDLTQAQVAYGCGLSFQQIQKYEAGQVDIAVSKLLALASVLGASLADLLEGLASGLGANDDAPLPSAMAQNHALSGGRAAVLSARAHD